MPIICPPPLSEIPTDALPPVREEWDYTPLPKPIPVTEQRWPEGTRPLVTVRCMTFNHERFIRQAIDGFLMQETTFPVQILVHDDASTDGTAAIVREYAERYPELIVAVLQPENLYSKGLRFPVADLLYGKYIAHCEGDDYWTHPRKLQLQCTLLESEPVLVLTYHPVLVLNLAGTPQHDYTTPPIGDNHLLDLATRGNYIHTPSVVLRNLKLPLPPEAYKSPAKDIFWWMTTLQHGQMAMIPNCMGVYRWGVGIWSAIDEPQRWVNTITIFLSLMQYFARCGDRTIATALQDRVVALCRRFAMHIDAMTLDQWIAIGPDCDKLVSTRLRGSVMQSRRWRWVPPRIRHTLYIAHRYSRRLVAERPA